MTDTALGQFTDRVEPKDMSFDELVQEVERLEVENHQLRGNAADMMIKEAKLLSINYHSMCGGEIKMASPLFGMLAEWCQREMERVGAENFIEQEIEVRAAGTVINYLVTITKRPPGNTPAKLLKKEQLEVSLQKQYLAETVEALRVLVKNCNEVQTGLERVGVGFLYPNQCGVSAVNNAQKVVNKIGVYQYCSDLLDNLGTAIENANEVIFQRSKKDKSSDTP